MNNASVLIVDKSIDHPGILSNTAFVLGLTAGRLLPDETFGDDVRDGDGMTHTYLTRIGHMVRKAGGSKLRKLRREFDAHPELIVVDYSEDAAPADYSAYAEGLGSHGEDEINYRAVYVWGPDEIVGPLTRNLSRL